MKINKNIVIALCLSFPVVSCAEVNPFSTSESGVKIVPMAKQNIPIEFKAEASQKLAQEKTLGYQLSSNDNARFLLNMKRHADEEFKDDQDNKYGVYDTHLKRNYTDIKLFFPFNGIKSINKSDVVGYAAVGTYVKTDKKEGWDGIKVLFNSPEIGSCAFSIMGIKAVQLAQETTEYLVNKKPSNKVIEGNINTGFVYTVNWYTDNNMSTLECANKNFDEKLMTNIIILANAIDKDVS